MRSIDLGPVERIPLGEGRTFAVGAEWIAVFRGRDGQLHATQALCPHRGGLLSDGMLGAGRVLCPLHAFAFRLADGHCLHEGGADIRVYDARATADGRIVVSLEPRKATVAA